VNCNAKNQEFEVENWFKLVGNRQRPYPFSNLRRLTVSKGAESLREPMHQQEDDATDDASPEQSAESQNQKSGSTASQFVWFIKMLKCLFAHRFTPGVLPENLRVPNCLLKCKLELTSVSLALRLLRCGCSWRRFGIGLSKCSLNCSHKTVGTISTGDDDRLATRLLASGNAPFVSDYRFKFVIKELLFGHPNKGSQFFT
jgi:hypothetical protein